MEKADTWETYDSGIVAECRVFDVRRHRAKRSGDGKLGDFYVIDSPDWVNIIAVTSQDEAVMIGQFRHGTNKVILELPGGLIDDGEEPIEAAQRELLEETGYTGATWKLIGSSHPNPAIQSNTIFHFVALGSEKTGETAFDQNENIVTKLVPLRDVRPKIISGEVTHSLVVAAFAYLWADVSS